MHKKALTSGNVSQSTVAEHAMDEYHTIKCEEAEVVNHHPYYQKRCALEAWYIRTERHKMSQDKLPLNLVYNPLVHLLCLHHPTDLVGHHHCYLCLFTLAQPTVVLVINFITLVISFTLSNWGMS